MEENEDEPEDVRRATPVEGEIVEGEKDEKAKDEVSNVKKEAKARCDKNLKKKSKANGNTDKSDGDCCRGRRGESPKTPKTTTVFIHEKPCILPKLEIIPRQCLSKKEYIDLLATPSRKCPPSCLRKPVVRKIRPVSARINELSLPTRQRITATLEERGSTLPPEFVDNLIKVLEGEACMTPEQASRYLRDKKKHGNKKQKKDSRYRCKEKSKKKRSQRVNSLGLDEEAVKCQYLMAERFVKGILEWKCSIPKEEFKDIADVILRRLSYTLNYTPMQEEDRKSQQMRLLADMVASWIAGVLFEVAEVHKKELEEECEKRRKEKEMETDESDEEEDEDKDEEEDEEEEDEEEEEEEEEEKSKKDKKKKGKEDKEKVDKPGKKESPENDDRETEDEKGDEEESGEESEKVAETSVETEVSDATTETEEEPKKTQDEEVAVDEAELSEEEQRIEAEKKLKEEEELEAAEAEQIKAEQEAAELKRQEEEEAEKKRQEELEEEKIQAEAAEEEARKKKQEEEEELQRIKQEEEEAEKKKQEEEEAEKERQEIEAQKKKEEEEEKEAEEKKKQEELEQQKKVEEEETGKEKGEGEKVKQEQLETEEESTKASKDKEEREKKEIEEKLKDRKSSMKMGDIRQIFKTELSFVTFGRIFDTVDKIVQDETLSSGDDPISSRIKYAIYEKFTNLIKAEDPKLLTENLKDVVNVLAGRISSWLAMTITDSQLDFMEKHPAEVESVDIRNWSSWVDSTTSTADRWISWIRKTIREAETMQEKKVTRSEWHNWTKSVDTNALLWRRYYLQMLHQANRNLTAVDGRKVVKTGQKGKQIQRELEMKVTDLEVN